MGGAADLPQRSSSPLKRRASDLEWEAQSSQNDVDMIVVPEEASSEPTDISTRPTHPGRTQSVDMLRDEQEADGSTIQAEVAVTASKPTTSSSNLYSPSWDYAS
jgi:ubiquitin carboxyl-terminal hydrolase 4/11/15